MSSSKMIITLVNIFVLFTVFSCVSSTEFEVGGEDGWIVPKSRNHADMFNQWASKNRFKVGDSIHFKYKKDSVLVVSKEEYKNCNPAKPELYSTNGDTVFKLDRSGLYYFISGASGHCEKGQKMILKVMEIESPPESESESEYSSPPPSTSLSASTPTPKKSNAFKSAVRFNSSGFVVFATLVVSVFGLA